MHGLNKTFIMGYLGSHPQTYSSKQGSSYTALSIATHRQIGAEGDRRDTTDWHYVRVWGKQGEACVKFLKKGYPVFIEGYLTQYSQQKDDGKTERKTGITAQRVQFLPRSQREELTSTGDAPADSSEDAEAES
jgi:single-strand DNA-binding protein